MTIKQKRKIRDIITRFVAIFLVTYGLVLGIAYENIKFDYYAGLLAFTIGTILYFLSYKEALK